MRRKKRAISSGISYMFVFKIFLYTIAGCSVPLQKEPFIFNVLMAEGCECLELPGYKNF